MPLEELFSCVGLELTELVQGCATIWKYWLAVLMTQCDLRQVERAVTLGVNSPSTHSVRQDCDTHIYLETGTVHMRQVPLWFVHRPHCSSGDSKFSFWCST